MDVKYKISDASWVNLTVIFAMFIWSFSAGIVNISLPTIAQFLDVSTSTVSWVIISHLLVLISLILIFGRLADYVGHKTIFLWGIFIFTVSSYLCGLSLDFNSLIIYRLIQGLGSAMLLSVAPAIISATSRSNTRGMVFGYISLATTLGLSLGYLIGGYITEYLGWNWIFFLNVPLGIIAFLMALSKLNGIPKKSLRKEFDILGGFLSFLLFLSLILTLETIGDPDVQIITTILGVVASLIIVVIFIYWELNHPHPLIHLRLFKNPYLTLSVFTSFLTTLVLTGTIFLVPFYLELVKSYTTEFSGMIVFASTLLVILFGPLSGWLTDKFGAKKINSLGAVLLVSSLGLFTLFDSAAGLVFIFISLSIRAISDGVANPANSKMVLSHSPPDMLNTVSSLLNAARYFGLVMGVVIFQSIFNYTISKYAVDIEATASGALEMTLPVGSLTHGFQTAFYLGVFLSILIIIFTIVGNEYQETGDTN